MDRFEEIKRLNKIINDKIVPIVKSHPLNDYWIENNLKDAGYGDIQVCRSKSIESGDIVYLNIGNSLEGGTISVDPDMVDEYQIHSEMDKICVKINNIINETMNSPLRSQRVIMAHRWPNWENFYLRLNRGQKINQIL